MHLGLFIGDTHVGAEQHNALSLSPVNAGEQFILDCFNKVIGEVERKKSLGYVVDLFCGGDSVDLPGKENRDHATLLYQKLADVCNGDMYGTLGTPYHVGPGGEEDAQVFDNIGIPRYNVKAVWRNMPIGSIRIAWAHHGVPIAGTPEGDDKALSNFAGRVQNHYLSFTDNVPELFVGHHVHRSSGMVGTANRKWRGSIISTSAMTVPCFSLPDDYATKKMTWWLPTIGASFVNFDTGRVHTLLYEIPESILYNWYRTYD